VRYVPEAGTSTRPSPARLHAPIASRNARVQSVVPSVHQLSQRGVEPVARTRRAPPPVLLLPRTA
jgi:hypothetical protein